VQECVISGDYFSKDEAANFSAKLLGKRHFFEDVEEIVGSNSQELTYAFF
jgi:hypothetical protein